jgi:hypothetical protein
VTFNGVTPCRFIEINGVAYSKKLETFETLTRNHRHQLHLREKGNLLGSNTPWQWECHEQLGVNYSKEFLGFKLHVKKKVSLLMNKSWQAFWVLDG